MLIWEVATAYLVEVPLLIWEVATTYLFLLHNNATLWSNLQDCKISNKAEIPKLDRVWQYSTVLSAFVWQLNIFSYF